MPSPVPRSGVRQRLLFLTFSLAAITYLDRVCISAVAPSIMKDLDLSVVRMSFIFSAFTLAYSLFEIPAGWMGDVIGPRRVLTRLVLWWSAFTILTATARSQLSLAGIRFLFGAGEAGAFPNMSRANSRWFPLAERGRANGILFLGSRVGGALAPVFALQVARIWGWRACFVVFGIFGVLWVWAWHHWYRDDPAEHPDVSPEELAWIRQDETAEHAAEGRSEGKVPWGRIATNRNLYTICLMYFCFGYGLYFYFTWLPTYLINVLGFSSMAGGIWAGMPFVLAGGADVAGGWLTDSLSRAFGLKIGRSWLGFVAFAGSAALLYGSTRISDRTGRAALIVLALACADLALSACWAVCLDVGRNFAGVVTGCMNTFGNLGGVVGPMVVGYTIQWWNSWSVPFYITSAIYLIGAISWLAIDPLEQIDPPNL